MSNSSFALKSVKTGMYLCLEYSPLYKEDYDISFKCKDYRKNSVKLTLLEHNGFNYIRFFNRYYLCRDKGKLVASRDKTKILLFKVQKI